MDTCLETVPLESYDTIIEQNLPNSQCWGRLLPLSSEFSVTDLVKDEMVFGRGEENDVQFLPTSFISTSHFQTYSKSHFKISKIEEKVVNATYIYDLSVNGTFVNGVKIGKGKKQILSHNDEISLSNIKNKAFLFMDLNYKNENEIPEELNKKYILSKTLGRGACGEVKLAFERETSRKLAIKIILKNKFGLTNQNTNSNDVLMNEVKILKSLNHPCIIGIEDVIESSDALYIVMEFVAGGELFDRVILKGSLSEKETQILFYQIFSGVKYLHDQGISHRDLKPENILLTSDESECLIKVSDFGISKFIDDNTVLKTFCGTPTYLAPEILQTVGLGQYTKEVDCWSLGVVLFICLAGFPPFSSDRTDMPLNEQILTASYQHYLLEDNWLNISQNAKDLLLKLLTVDPKQRISTCEVLNHSWFQDDMIKNTALEIIYPSNNEIKLENTKRKEIEELENDVPVKRPCSESI